MPNYTIRAVGLADTVRALKQVDKELPKELRLGLNRVVDVLVGLIRPKVPTLTGAARASIKSRSTQTVARIAVGGDKASYYPWLDFGGAVGRNKSVRRSFVQEGRYVYPTLRENRNEIMQQLEDVTTEVTARAGL